MSKKKPQKRIVSKERYVQVMGKKVGFYSIAVCSLGIGSISLLYMFSVWCNAVNAYVRNDVHTYHVANDTLGNFWPFLFGWFVLWMWISRKLFRDGKAIEPVQPITERNTHLLPLQDTLVRSSDLPPSEQQAELLRAVQTGQETPPEQLLRSVAGDE